MVAFSGAGLQGIMAVFAGFGTVVQVVVLLSLILASVVCWGIIFQKARLLRKIRHSVRFLDALYTANDLAFTAAAARRFALSPLARLFRAAHQRFEAGSEGRALMGDDNGAGQPTPTPHACVTCCVWRRLRKWRVWSKGCPFWRPLRVWRRLLVCLALSGVSCSRFMPLANAGASLAVVGREFLKPLWRPP